MKMRMKNELTNVLIAGLSLRVQDGIKVLLTGQPGLGLILQADTIPFAEKLFCDYFPGLVFLDFEQPEGEIAGFLSLIEATDPKIFRVGIVDTPRKGLVALEVGVDSVLVRGFSQDELTARVREATAHQFQ
jgi:DNA-binding NarL/FixJ family response regulator